MTDVMDKKIVDSKILSVQPIYGRWAVVTGLCGHCPGEHATAIGGLVAALVEVTFEDGEKYTTVETMMPDSFGHYSFPAEEPEEGEAHHFVAFLDSQVHPEEDELVDFVKEVRQQIKPKDTPPSAPAGGSDPKILTLNPTRNSKNSKPPTRH